MSSGEAPAGVLVLGMHRSGTSAATRALNLAGLALCRDDDLYRATGGNASGHWESTSLFQLNDRALARLGRTWWCPPSSPVTPDGLDARAAKTFDLAHPDGPWVWKDPRAAVLLGWWRAVLARPLAGVIAVRHPYEVARSLAARDGWSATFGLALWERSTRLLLAQARGMPSLLATYDQLVDDPLTWYGTAASWLASLGLSLQGATDAAVASFVDASQRHHRIGADRLRQEHPGTADVYDAVLALVGSHAAFEPPVLPPEPAWVEAALVAGDERRPGRLRALPVTTSAVVPPGTPLPGWAERVDPGPDLLLRAGGGLVARPLPGEDPATTAWLHAAFDRAARGQADPSDRLQRLGFRADQGGPPVDVVLVGEPSDPRLAVAVERVRAGGGDPLVVATAPVPGVRHVVVDAGLSPGARRALGVGACAHGVVVLADLGLELAPGWRAALGRVAHDLTAGVVVPWLATSGARAQVHAGQRIVGPGLARRWTTETPTVTGGALLAVRADVLAAVGGLDAAYDDVHDQAADLCLRVAALGLRVVPADGFRAVVDGPLSPPPGPLADRIRLATVHLADAELQASLVAWERHPAYADSLAAVALSDAPDRRRPGPALIRRRGFARHEHVFVGGVHQCGGNVLARLLGSHPDASSFRRTGKPDDEGQHLQAVLPKAQAHGGPGRFALDPDAHLTGSSSYATRWHAEQLRRAWSPHWDLERRVLVEQSPQNVVRSRLLAALFPGAHQVAVVRHPLAVALATRPWTPDLSIGDLVEHWLAAWEVWCGDVAGLQRTHVVAYEELVTNPRDVLRSLGSRLGLEQLEDAAELVTTTVHDTVQEHWAELVAAGDLRWFDRLQETCGDRVRRAGYDLADLGKRL